MAFTYRDGALCAELVPLDDIARRFGTPCYVYSRAAIERHYGEFARALAGRRALVAYSVKANSNLGVLALLAKLGAGFDIVSGGELARVLAVGGDARKVLFSGVGKTEAEIAQALEAGILCLNLESEAELQRVGQVAARLGKRAPIAFRVNPDVDAKTHPYISTGLRQNKFGVPYDDAERLYREAARLPQVSVIGIGCHIGSLMTSAGPFVDAAGRILALAERLEGLGIALSHIDLGGGFGIRYRDETPASIGDFVDGALGILAGRAQTLIVDPGRAIVGNAGVLLARVEYVKRSAEKNFLVVDAAMNDLIRPALYGAWHEVLPVRAPQAPAGGACDVVGPVCESADFLAKDRALAAQQGDLLAVMSAGAYAMVMSSNYNSRPRAAEVLVDGGRAHLVRRRETLSELFAAESIPAW
ncbi:MAG TPA: diaminopimelate decarboxylase [Burkholderiales bacterium]|jgi:diaminopimelate decarboxylase|nr:diaminopimelate decarboxylase [Burkholderiales bacterium]